MNLKPALTRGQFIPSTFMLCAPTYTVWYIINTVVARKDFFLVEKGPAADATDAPQPCGLLCNPVMMMMMIIIIICPFPSNGAPVE
jgi:hypothetical protein